jgi:hypothetical protein
MSVVPAVTYLQAAWFRARKTGVVTAAPSLSTAAQWLVGAQAQIEAPTRWGLASRTIGTPAADVVRQALITDRSVVRAWGQRDTVHIYHTDDWHLFATAQQLWPRSARTGALATHQEVLDFVATINTLQRSFCRSDVLDMVPGRLVDAFAAKPVNNDPPARMAATRLIWQAGTLGYLSSTEMIGREQGYAARSWWVPQAPWPELTPEAACVEVVRRYLQRWAPARPQDIAHFLGANVRDVRRWLAPLADQTAEVTLACVPEHVVLQADLVDLTATPPVDDDQWPARLLPAYDTQMMTHGNKDFVVPNPEHRPKIWDKAAIVNATVLYRGQFVATWQQALSKRKVQVTITPLPGVAQPPRAHLQAEAERLASHLGLDVELQ